MSSKPPARKVTGSAAKDWRAQWIVDLKRVVKLPPSWPVDWTPDGSKPCACCGKRKWSQTPGQEGWCCMTCHPAPRTVAETETLMAWRMARPSVPRELRFNGRLNRYVTDDEAATMIAKLDAVSCAS